MPPPSTSPFDIASVIAKLQGAGLGDFLSTLRGGQTSPSTPQPNTQEVPPGKLPGEPDFLGRLPFHPQYAGLSGQPSGEDRLITLRQGAAGPSNEMVQGEDGLWGENPMTKALRLRQAAGEEATRQAQSEETDALVDELSRSKARRDQAWDQEMGERSAASSARSEAMFQAQSEQRSRRTTPKPGGGLRGPRGGRGGARG